jgi:hypothetical protein
MHTIAHTRSLINLPARDPTSTSSPEAVFDAALGVARSLTTGWPSSAPLSGYSQPRRGRLRRLHSGAADDGSENARVELAAFQYDMYRGNQLPFIEPHQGESDDEFGKRANLRVLNLSRVVIDVLSGLYRSPVERRLIGGSASFQDLFTSAWRANSLDTVLFQADRMTRLQGTVGVQPIWQAGSLSYRVFPAHRFAVVRDPSNPAEALAVVTLSAGPLWDGRGELSRASFADIWTRDEYARVSEGHVVERRAHGYAALPFAFFRDAEPLDGFWVEGRGRSLCYDNAVLNARLSDLAQVVALQGFGVLQVTNPDPGQDMRMGPGRAMSFRVAPNTPYGVEFKQPGAPIAELVAELAESVRHILLSQRIPEHALSFNVSANVSGAAIAAANLPVIEDRLERARLFAGAEARLHAASVAVAAVHARLDSREAPQLSVSFPEPSLARSLDERRVHDDWALKQGLLTPWQIMFRDNPDGYVSLDAAREAWIAQRAELQRLGVAPII